MVSLASGSVGEIFAIPVSEWTAINKRVGEVLATQNVKDYIPSVLSGYPDLLNSCLQWQSYTFSGLVENSQKISAYSAQAISDFGSLNAKVKEVVQSGGQTLPDNLKQETIDLLKKLSTSTAPIAAQSNLLSSDVINFLKCNSIVDIQMAKFKGSLDVFWEPLGNNIKVLEDAVGHVTGVWNAITNDLEHLLSLPVIVTIPFIESLNLDVAIASWQDIQVQAKAFPAMTAGQEQYWTNPF
ncbi:hypothetical protein [Flavobacterium fluviatile]|uniref:hypothetical protein n=1 Tax=Flavobacterium fluviatile TaxID=1862387 RepID=UPI0013D2B2DA|nr:hypothetical protein [Flavobacterium fluviatile]